jgi:DeoR family transcriptional regulator, fructose operon transcriptional repressor
MIAIVTDDRRSKLLEIVQRKGFASLPELVTELAVSESTIRRDLAHLEQVGVAKRTHGGVFYTGPTPQLAHFRQRQSAEWDRKKAIAAAAARLIEDGDTVLLDGGSTTYELAQHLVGRPLQVVTNSLPVANLFSGSAESDLVVIGGYVHNRSGALLGEYACQVLKNIHVRRSVMSSAGITAQGLFNSNQLLVATQRAMIDCAEEVLVVADSTKFGHHSLAHLCPLSAVRTFVVDSDLSGEWREQIESAGCELVLATMETANLVESSPN